MGFTEWMEEIERKRRIREQIKSLRNQMGTIDSEIITMGEVIYFYTDYKTVMSEKVSVWASQYESYSLLDLAPDIQVTDSFEGTSAQQLALDVPTTVEAMANAASHMSELLPGIADQVQKIEEYVEELQLKKQGIQAQIDALLAQL